MNATGKRPRGDAGVAPEGLSQAPGGRRVAACGIWAVAVMMLAGCDQLGIETPQKTAERQAAEAKAIGSACRHAMRAIEDCYTLNPQADKAAVFGGWREMDEYMRENKLDGIAPVVPRPVQEAASKPAAAASKAKPKPSADDEEDEGEADTPSSSKARKGKAAH